MVWSAEEVSAPLDCISPCRWGTMILEASPGNAFAPLEGETFEALLHGLRLAPGQDLQSYLGLDTPQPGPVAGQRAAHGATSPQ